MAVRVNLNLTCILIIKTIYSVKTTEKALLLIKTGALVTQPKLNDGVYSRELKTKITRV